MRTVELRSTGLHSRELKRNDLAFGSYGYGLA